MSAVGAGRNGSIYIADDDTDDEIYAKTHKCSDFITEKSLLYATSAYGGFEICPELSPNYIHNFMVACVDYYSDENKLNDLGGKLIKEIENEMKILNVAKDQVNIDLEIENQMNFINARNILNNSVKRYETIQKFKNMKNNKLYIQNIIADIFTQWIKFILPIPDTKSFVQQTSNVLVQLMDAKFKTILSENINDVYDTLNFSNKSNTYNLKKMTSPLKHIVLNMVFYLCTPQNAISFNIDILGRYRIFKNRQIFNGDLQDQHNILAIVEELNIKDLESQFNNVYRIPVKTLESVIIVPNGIKDNDLTNVLDGINCITTIMSTKLEKPTNLTDTAKFRSRLAKTDSSRAAFLFVPTEFMFNEGSFKKPLEFYTFWDLLCGQYYQEYKTGIDIEHIVTSSRLQYLADYGATFNTGDKDAERDFFNFFLSIFNFALKSYFVQICVTNTCNRSAGDKVRWGKTIQEYKTLLTFVCTLYWAVEKNKMDVCKIGDKTVRAYIEQMYANSDIIHNKEIGKKDVFLKFPTMIVPKKFLYEYNKDVRIKLLKKDPRNPLRENYEFVKDVGMFMNKYRKDKKISKFITDMFNKRENTIKKQRLEKYVTTGDIQLIPQQPVQQSSQQPDERRQRRPDNNFGNTPQSNLLDLFQDLPSIATMERRVQRMNDLLLTIPYQKPLVQRLLEFETANGITNKIETTRNQIETTFTEKLKTKSPNSSKSSSFFKLPKLFNTSKISP